MKRTITALFVAGVLFMPAALSHAPAARASGTFCSIGDVNVSGDAFHHEYDYTHWYHPHGVDPCQPLFHVKASYDVGTGETYGAINRPGEIDVEEAGTWKCPGDPFSEHDQICTTDLHRVFVLCPENPGSDDFLTEQLCNYEDAGATEPAAAFFLSDFDRNGLAGQLGNAIKAHSSQILRSTSVLHNVPTSSPTLPDLAVTDIRLASTGQTTVGSTLSYDVVVANTGADLPGSGQVQVLIQVSGSVSYTSMAQTPAGFSCSGAGPILCVGPIGGSSDAPITTSVVFRVQIHADKTGLGSLSAAADPNNVIQESDENNNARTLPITVK